MARAFFPLSVKPVFPPDCFALGGTSGFFVSPRRQGARGVRPQPCLAGRFPGSEQLEARRTASVSVADHSRLVLHCGPLHIWKSVHVDAEIPPALHDRHVRRHPLCRCRRGRCFPERGPARAWRRKKGRGGRAPALEGNSGGSRWFIARFRRFNIKTTADNKFPKKIISFYRYFGRNKPLSFQ